MLAMQQIKADLSLQNKSSFNKEIFFSWYPTEVIILEDHIKLNTAFLLL